MSLRQNRNGVSALMTWNLTGPMIGILTVITPINDVDPMPNCTLTIPAFVVSSLAVRLMV